MTTGKDQNTSQKPPADQVNLTSEGKRRATIEKVSKEILDKITSLGSQADSVDQREVQTKAKADKKTASAESNKAGFVFNVIDTINKKTTNTVSVDDSRFLIKRLEQLKDTEIKRSSEFKDRKETENLII